LAEWAAGTEIKVDQIRHSEKRRAEQTATIFAKHLSLASGVSALNGLNPNDDVALVAESIQGEEESIILVGHLPHLSRLVGCLMTGDAETEIVRFRNAGIVCRTQQQGKWATD
jgi:phosphohistidine phosphatase